MYFFQLYILRRLINTYLYVQYVPNDVDSCHGGGDVMDDGGLELVVQLLSLQHPLQANHFLLTL